MVELWKVCWMYDLFEGMFILKLMYVFINLTQNLLFSCLACLISSLLPCLLLCELFIFLYTMFRFVVIDLSAGPCTYGKIETEEGSVSPRTVPRIRNVMFPRSFGSLHDHTSHDNFMGHLAALIATTVEHVIAPDVR